MHSHLGQTKVQPKPVAWVGDAEPGMHRATNPSEKDGDDEDGSNLFSAYIND